MRFYIWGGGYMILVCWDGISTRQAGKNFNLRLYGKIKLNPNNAGQFPGWYLFRFVYIYFFIFFCKHILNSCFSRFGCWNGCMGKFRPNEAGSWQYNRGISPWRDKTFTYNWKYDLWRGYTTAGIPGEMEQNFIPTNRDHVIIIWIKYCGSLVVKLITQFSQSQNI